VEFTPCRRYEVSNGMLRVMPAFSISHQTAALRLASALLKYIEVRDLGRLLLAPCNVILNATTLIQPDIFFVRRERTGMIEAMNMWGAPDMVIEIISPGNQDRAMQIKRSLYSRFNVQEYWIADPGRETIDVLAWSEIGYLPAGTYGKTDQLRSRIFPKLALSLNKVFH
jgi:Uma2 family endonuclease